MAILELSFFIVCMYLLVALSTLLVSAIIMGNAAAKSFGHDAQQIIKKKLGESVSSEVEVATFAGGCFWGLELSFQRVPGVLHTEVGYTQGHKENPTYEEVCSGHTDHTEAVRLQFDPSAVTYSELLTVLWDRIDPTTLNQQGNDVGTQYRSGIYYHSEEQRAVAFASRDKEQQRWTRGSGDAAQPLPIVTEILPASTWFKAEEYHQAYLQRGGQCADKGDTSGIRCYG